MLLLTKILGGATFSGHSVITFFDNRTLCYAEHVATSLAVALAIAVTKTMKHVYFQSYCKTLNAGADERRLLSTEMF